MAFEVVELYKGKVRVRFNPETEGRYQTFLKDKQIYPESVTTIIKIKDKSFPLMTWMAREIRKFLFGKLPNIIAEDILVAIGLHKTIKAKAGNIGDMGHKWIEECIKYRLNIGPMPEMPTDPAVQKIVDAFLQFEEAHKIEYISTERVIYSLKHNFVGRMDIEAKVDGKHALVDIKTANGLYNEVRLQTAAYCKADEEATGKKKYKMRYAVRLTKETEEEYLKRMEDDGKENYPKFQVFEAMNLDMDDNNEKYQYRIDEDYEAFLHFKAGHEWNKKTDPYLLAQARKYKS